MNFTHNLQPRPQGAFPWLWKSALGMRLTQFGGLNRLKKKASAAGFSLTFVPTSRLSFLTTIYLC